MFFERDTRNVSSNDRNYSASGYCLRYMIWCSDARIQSALCVWIAELKSRQWTSSELSFLGMPCAQLIRSLWNWLTSAKHATPFAPANRAFFCSQIPLAQGRPPTRYRRTHSGVRHPLLAEIVGATRPDGRPLGELGPRPTRTANEESGSAYCFQAVELLPFLFELRLVWPEQVTCR